MLRDAPCADHLDVLVHETARACGVAHLDQRGELLVDLQDMARHLGREGGILRRPGDVLQRDELHHQHAIVRGLGDGKVKFAPGTCVAADIMDDCLGRFYPAPRRSAGATAHDPRRSS